MSDGVTITLTGNSVRKVKHNLLVKRRGVIPTAEVAVREVAHQMYVESQAMIPRKTGALASSAFEEIEVANLAVHGRVGYGGAYNKINPKSGRSTDSYALKRHESPRIKGATGTWKWLDKAYSLRLGNYMKVYQKHFETLMKGGIT